ncbi:MAG TPA: YeeE/YedE thiosulfate transporter family protein [Chiayiivirga sp.]|nr:YeeE/YedE thiosulfate transporter family protein [Xanthomonadaceae bacterium]HRN59017.1 YeeE/YedE thiosulfate transporter family protein [Chiayiivirga sp.]
MQRESVRAKRYTACRLYPTGYADPQWGKAAMKIRPIWNAHVAGVALGLVLLGTFLATGHGLGASGTPTAIAAVASNAIAPEATAGNDYLGPMVADGANPLNAWIVWEVIGVGLGALLAAWWSGHLRFRIEGPPRMNNPGRMALALGGGILSGFGARLAAGCTSGLGLSGGAVLATAGFVFLIGFFVAGILVGFATRRLWK